MVPFPSAFPFKSWCSVGARGHEALDITLVRADYNQWSIILWGGNKKEISVSTQNNYSINLIKFTIPDKKQINIPILCIPIFKYLCGLIIDWVESVITTEGFIRKESFVNFCDSSLSDWEWVIIPNGAQW